MMLGLKGENVDDVERFLAATLADPTANLSIEAASFFNMVPRKVALRESIKAVGHKGPILTMGGIALMPSLPAGVPSALNVASTWAGSIKKSYDHRQFIKLIEGARLVRPSASIPDKEKTLFLAQFAKYRDDTDTQGSIERWARFVWLFCFYDGKGMLVPASAHEDSTWVPAAIGYLKSFIGPYLPSYDTFIIQSAQEVLLFQKRHPAPVAGAMPQIVNAGARWMTDADLATSSVFTHEPRQSALLLGTLKDSGRAVFYLHNESLVTVGGSGSGKSQAHVITNLLHYPGSAFVLDVKGELWEKTAGYRQKTFGPCYRFSPTDRQGKSHCFDPFEAIPADPKYASNACTVMAANLVGGDSGGDKYWQSRARDYIWAFALLIALDHPPAKRNIGYLPYYLSLPTAFESPTSKKYLASESYKVMQKLREVAKKHNIPDLANTANAFENGLQDNARLESVFDTARQFSSIFARSSLVMSSLVRSQWRPDDLIDRQGTTIYISLRPGDLHAFAPIIRLIFQQHADLLITSHVKPKIPVTFFLDELPQLGAMPSITDLLDLGRSAGIRLWMFSQYYGQFEKAYGALAKGLIGGCRTSCWMRPDAQGIEFIKPALGETTNFFNNDKKPLATDAELRGREFVDDVVVVTPGEHPMRLSKVFAYKHIPKRMEIPPPPVPDIPPASIQPV